MCTFIWFCVIINGGSLRHDVGEGVGMGMHLWNVPILAVVVVSVANTFIRLVNQVLAIGKGIKKKKVKYTFIKSANTSSAFSPAAMVSIV
jgi:uncharacterized membrane protein YhiD involved in acid resistance